ncbi:hypothetical protein JCM33374_g3925 [Metschnikowia sp. JCM 33374]|nr:hypothetical protein JCM33374_g3925 [Metschnikowia sp. JCM 33374]
MSSLSQQLQAISAKNASVALDRKSRAFVHSQSLIFDPKAAAAQDHEYIYQIACEGLEELVEIDSRFARFQSSLFSPASVTFDRNVSTKDVVAQAEKNAIAFINMAAPYFALSPALKATEWLVRRYHINIHCAETLLLAALPYHTKPVFSRFMGVVPKSSWPAIFSPIIGYKETMGLPPQASILKCFYTDAALFRLYTQYVVDGLRNKTVYKEQLVFYLSNTAQFLHDRTFPFSSTLASDVRITIYAVLSVLCSMVPLSKELVFTLTRSILQSDAAFAAPVQRQTFILLGQLWNFYNESDLPTDVFVFTALPVHVILDHESLLHRLAEENYHVSKFLFFYFADKINAADAEAAEILPLLRPDSSPFVFEALAAKLLRALDTPLANDLKPRAVNVFERLVKTDKQKLLALLDTHNKTLGDLEMVLSRTLGAGDVDADVNGSVYEADYVKLAKEVPRNVEVGSLFACHVSTTDSFLSSSSSTEFASLVSVLLQGMQGAEVSEQIRSMFAFLRIVIKSNTEAHCSFLLRVALTPSVPSNIRLVALKCMSTRITEALRSDDTTAFYLLVPLLLLALGDASKTIRGYTLKLLGQIRELTADLLEREGKKVKCKLFMEHQIYGEVEASQRSIISPQDGNAMLRALLKNEDLTSGLLVDAARVQNLIFDGLFKASKSGKKKFGSVLLRTFVLNQWSLTSLPLAFKSRAWSIVSARNVAQSGTEDRFVFVEDLKSFFSKIDSWKADALAANIPFEDVEKAIVEMVGGETSNEENINKEISWFLQALSSERSLQLATNQEID